MRIIEKDIQNTLQRNKVPWVLAARSHLEHRAKRLVWWHESDLVAAEWPERRIEQAIKCFFLLRLCPRCSSMCLDLQPGGKGANKGTVSPMH